MSTNQHAHHDAFLATGTRYCYQCEEPVTYLFADGRGSCCTRLTQDEIEGNITEGETS